MEEQRRPPAVLTAYYMPKPGGLCKRLFRAMEALLARGCTVHYAAVRRFPIEHPNCHWHRFWWPEHWPARGALFWAWLHLAMPWQLLYLGLRHRVTHAFAFSINYGAMLFPLRLIQRLPYTLFLRADTRRNNQINGVALPVLWFEWLLESAALWRGRTIAVSQSLLDQVLCRHQIVRPKSCLVLPNEPPSDVVPGAPYSGGTLVLAVVGVIETRKRIELAIDAMRRLGNADLVLRVFGSGPGEKALRRHAADLVMSGRVEFMGWCPTESIWGNVHLLLHPSQHEGHSNSMLEALSAGLPLLASDIPEHREWLPAEFLIDGSDVDAWAKAIFRVANGDDSYRRFAMRAQTLARQLDFDWEARASGEILARRESLAQEVCDD